MLDSLDLAFVSRAPNKSEQQRLMLVLSTFCDGSGINNGGYLPGWRDVERTVAAVLGGTGSENKEVFDVTVSPAKTAFDVGFSVKCKNLPSPKAMTTIETTGRVYMELANSSAKFWAALRKKELTEAVFKEKLQANAFGDAVLKTVHSWHLAAAESQRRTPGRELNIEESVYLTLSNGTRVKNGENIYQWHSFPMRFPNNVKWDFRSDKCLRGFDPDYPAETLFDWYGLSGGQLKYYPRAANALFRSEQFSLKAPPPLLLLKKAANYFPADWKQTAV